MEATTWFETQQAFYQKTLFWTNVFGKDMRYSKYRELKEKNTSPHCFENKLSFEADIQFKIDDSFAFAFLFSSLEICHYWYVCNAV